MKSRQTVVTYNVKVDIHELQNCVFSENGKEVVPNPYIDIDVCGQRKSTEKRQQATSASFDSQFNFTVNLNAEEFGLATVEVTVNHAYMFSSAVIGTVLFSLTHLYSRPQHWIYRQWVCIRLGDNPSEVAGYLLVTAGIFGPGDSIPVVEDSTASIDPLEENEIGRVSRVPKLNFQSYNLTVNIHRGHDITGVPTGGGTILNPFVKVGHGGSKESTRALTGSSPDWNTTIQLPAFIPSYDDNILIELWHAGPTPTFVGVCGLQLQHLIKQPQEPFWLNYYWKPPPTDLLANVGAWIKPKDAYQISTEFAGRLLVSADVHKIQVASPKRTRPAAAVPEPPISEFIIFTDIYEVTTMIGDSGLIQVDFCVGPHRRTTPPMRCDCGSYFCDDSIGRFEPSKLYLPPLNQAYDVFLYVSTSGVEGGLFTSGGTRRIAFARMKLTTCLGFENKPTWYTLSSIDTGFEIFSVLATIHCGLTEDAPIERGLRLTYNLKNYLFRSMIYEGANMPCFTDSGFPSAYVKVELSGRTTCTRAVEADLNPAWYEAFEIEVPLPDNLSLAPDVTVEVWSDSNSMLGGSVSLGYFTFPIRRIPVVWDTYPEWQDLKSGSASQFLQHNKGKILCSFELLPANSTAAKRHPFFDDIRPSTYPGTVHFYLVGIRMFKAASSPDVTISYGRDYENSALPLWSDSTGPPRSGQGGNWNFLKDVELDVALPKRHIHNAALELTITDAKQGFRGDSKIVLGSCYVLLTPLLPWLTDNEKAAAKDTFKIATLEEVLLEVAEIATDAARTGPIGISETTDQDVNWKKLNPRLYIPYNDPDAANFQSYAIEDYLSYDDEEEKEKEKKLLLTAGRFTPALTAKLTDIILTELDEEKTVNTSSKEHVDDQNTTTVEPHIHFSNDTNKGSFQKITRESDKPKPEILDLSMGRKMLNFELVLPDEDMREEERREEISHELEADIGGELLPYHSVPVIKSTRSGVPETVGYAKYICMVYDKNTSEGIKNTFDASLKWIGDQYTLTRELVVRVYILSARGLIPPSGSTDPRVYVWVKNGEDTIQMPGGLGHNIRDSGNIRRQGFRPEFNKCFSLHCSIPEHTIVKISLINAGGLTEELIGATHIDVEDRWFNPKYQLLMHEDSAPIEQRTLKLEGRTTSQGSLRVWIEMMTHDIAQSKPLAILASPDPEDFQLRVVIWKVKNVPMEDNSSVSLFVRGTYQLDNSNIQIQDTDVHYNSRDGSGKFNWRFVWNVTVPAQFPFVKLQIYNSHLLQGSDPVSECSIDLAYDFAVARKRCSSKHGIPLSWYRCYHPARPGKDQGMVQVEASLLPAKEADFVPVGKGREDPNRNPYLEPITENRTYVDWKYVGEQVASATNSIMANARYGFIIMAVVLIIGGILFLVVILK